jgi:hypothetical protein
MPSVKPPKPSRFSRPPAPAVKPPASKADNELAIKAILCSMIGLGVLLSPYFITSPGMQGIVAKSTLVGWFALVLGIGFGVAWARRRRSARNS